MLLVILSLGSLVAACQHDEQNGGAVKPVDITFLTRSDCPKSAEALEHLRQALSEQDVRATVTTIDLGELPAQDNRTGYGTPTILVEGADLFGRESPGPTSPT